MSVVLLRHASAGDRHAWEGDDRSRPLDPKGQRQAEALVAVLDALEISSIISSPARRCVQTVEPLAELRGLDITENEVLWEGHGEDCIALVQELVGTDTVLCTHGDNIPDVLTHLARTQGLSLGRHPDWKKASAWVVDAVDGRYISARYLPPPPV